MRRSMGSLIAIAAIVGITLLWGLARRPAGAENPGRRRQPYDPLTTRTSDEGDPGEVFYMRYCSGCHGVNGDGKGPAAAFLDPKPRDFTLGTYKFTSRPAGSLPTDADLLRTITYGLKGTAMPPWRFLPLHERESIVQYLKTFVKAVGPSGPRGIERWREDEKYERPAIPFHENPFEISDPDSVAQAVEKGRLVYHEFATCWQCHPAYMSREELAKLIGLAPRPDLEKAIAKPDAWGQEIPPPDFPTVRLKSVRNLEDLYRVVLAGVGGTAMPTWKHALTAEQAWALTIYVDSIRKHGSIRFDEGGER